MVGDLVGGYAIKESLGSGRVGLLYLAVHPQNGHRAVVRRRLDDSDSADEFGAEAAQAMSLSNPLRVERRTSRAGVKVLLAIVDEAAPGSGRTEYANTQLLPDKAQLKRGRRSPLLLLIPLLIVGVFVGGWLTGQRDPPLDPPPTEVFVVEPISSPVRTPEPASVEAITPTPVALKAPALPSLPTCQPDADWRRNSLGDLSELMTRAAPYEALSRWTATEYDELSVAIASALTPAQCGLVTARLRSFHRRVLAAEKH